MGYKLVRYLKDLKDFPVHPGTSPSVRIFAQVFDAETGKASVELISMSDLIDLIVGNSVKAGERYRITNPNNPNVEVAILGLGLGAGFGTIGISNGNGNSINITGQYSVTGIGTVGVNTNATNSVNITGQNSTAGFGSIGIKLEKSFSLTGNSSAVGFGILGVVGGAAITATVTAFTGGTVTGNTVSIASFTATGQTVSGYMITESSTKPLVNDSGWLSSPPNSYRTSSGGTKTLYAWAKDTNGVSNATTISVTFPTLTQILNSSGQTTDGWNLVGVAPTTTGFQGTTSSQGAMHQAVTSFSTGNTANKRILEYDVAIPVLGPGATAGVDFSSFYLGFLTVNSMQSGAYQYWYKAGYSCDNGGVTQGFVVFRNSIWTQILNYANVVANRIYHITLDCKGDGNILFTFEDTVTKTITQNTLNVGTISLQSIQGVFNGATDSVSPVIKNIKFSSY